MDRVLEFIVERFFEDQWVVNRSSRKSRSPLNKMTHGHDLRRVESPWRLQPKSCKRRAAGQRFHAAANSPGSTCRDEIVHEFMDAWCAARGVYIAASISFTMRLTRTSTTLLRMLFCLRSRDEVEQWRHHDGPAVCDLLAG
ncbi:hypothetical protein HPB50_021249 [Hyalomma asiaticum]|uniref:Uncharacterized protein n=1 Tax=Hyalomma asiaticum TaxID=266040 RepID=A0ACB7RWH0_HYAAI|nr:hypothetical protein HPB50_021249 [Hyalomma asiaticum]